MRGPATRSILILVLVAACSACGEAAPAADVPAVTSPPATPIPMRSATPPSPFPPATTRPTATVEATAGPAGELPMVNTGTVVASVADDGLRMRSLPGLGEASEPYEPLLPMGIELFVLGGPVHADGYAWYQVAPIGTDFPNSWGWVAVASRDGEPWVTPAATDCPPVPARVDMLYAYDFGTEMACFGRQPITLTARILDCNCSIDPGQNIAPPSFRWQFSDEGAGPLLLTPKGTITPTEEYLGYDALLRVATDADVPVRLPVGEDVQVTGMFDHPAAADCMYDAEFDGEAEASPYCRGLFLVTSIR